MKSVLDIWADVVCFPTFLGAVWVLAPDWLRGMVAWQWGLKSCQSVTSDGCPSMQQGQP